MIWPDIEQALPSSLFAAQEYLELLHSITHMLQLYEECFPDACRYDLAQGLSIFPEPGHEYSPCEVHFFHLVDAHYFPFPLDFLPDDLCGERRLIECIPIASMGIDLSDEGCYEWLPVGWKVLLYLLGEIEEEWLRADTDEEHAALFDIPVERGEVSLTLLTLRAEAQGGMLAHLALVMQMLRNDTDSVWLNVTAEDPCMDALWTREDMEEIRAQYHLAKEIRANAHSFCEWLEEEPVARFILVARLWNSCLRDTKSRTQNVRLSQEVMLPGRIRWGAVFGITLPERIHALSMPQV